MTPEQYITKKCVEANPSIMELKFGCRVNIEDQDNFPYSDGFILNNKGDIWMDGFHVGLLRKFGGYSIKALGRPITLADVLLALNQVLKKIVENENRSEKMPNVYCDGTIHWGRNNVARTQFYTSWNLLTDLNGQSEETKTLLAKNLGWKAE